MQGGIESNARSYCRSFPDVFDKAEGSLILDTNGRHYVNFLTGCGSLNYEHNHPDLRKAFLSCVTGHGIAVSFDMGTQSKDTFMVAFSEHILQPRGLVYKLQFLCPTGANALESAIKLARKVTGRYCFTNAFHRCSGALTSTANEHHRGSSGTLLTNVNRVPYDDYLGPDVETPVLLEKLLSDPASGFDAPVAIILETNHRRRR